MLGTLKILLAGILKYKIHCWPQLSYLKSYSSYLTALNFNLHIRIISTSLANPLWLSIWVISHIFVTIKKTGSQVWWFTTIIPALKRLRQEAREFEASLDYTVKLCLKNNFR
jgi:hypothetical protein